MKARLPIMCGLLCLFMNLSLFAGVQPATLSVYPKMLELNREWVKHKDAAPHTSVYFPTDQDNIAYHLTCVEKHLRANTPDGLSKQALQKRLALLDALRIYTERRAFPINSYHAERTPYFIDEYGNYCAVGHLISVSGHDALAQRIKKEYNYSYIPDIKTDGLPEWASEHGFTADELAWIQPTYSPQERLDPVQGGPGGPVTAIVEDPYSNRMILGGQFDKLNNMPCMNIGYMQDNQLHCLGEGVDGLVKAVAAHQEVYIAAGHLRHNGVRYPVAIFKDGSWEYLQIPGRDGVSATALSTGVSMGDLQVAINHPSITGTQEIWLYEGSQWKKLATVNGMVLNIKNTSHGRVYAGAFHAVTVHRNGQSDSVFSANSVLLRSYSGPWYTLGTQVSDTVMVVEDLNSGGLLLGGTCATAFGRSNICLTRYLNEVLQPLILHEHFGNSSPAAIRYLKPFSAEGMYMGGRFNIDPMMGTWGRNLAVYDLVYNVFGPIANLNAPVNAIGRYKDNWYVGGDFTGNVSAQVEYLAMMDAGQTTIGKVSPAADVQLYPNPAYGALNIKAMDNNQITSLQVYDLMGKSLISQSNLRISSKHALDVSQLRPGLYVLHLGTANGALVRRTFEVR